MQRDFESQAEACSNKKRHRRIWKRIVGTLACVVVFCTTYALILPAITMEGMKCGMEEHTHSMDCYVKNEPEVLTELSCSPESLGCHVHSDSCKDADGNIICGYADYIIHTHNDSCYDSKGNKICELEEIEEHVHTDECYEIETVTSQESAVEETAGESGETVSADSTETANTEASEDNTTVKKTLVCTKEAIEEHKHTEECYDEDNNLICGKLETIKHVHEDSCFQKTEEAIRAETLTCGLKESDEHQHTALCYGDWELVCGLEEHTHTEECYPEEETETTDDESADTNAEVSEEVQNVITLIDEMPSADEIDAKMKEFEDAEDYEGEEAWLTEVYQQVAKAYYYYDLLSDEEKELVSNADKLLELEYIWSVTEYVSAIDSEVVDQDDVVAASSTKDFIELNLYDYFGTANASANGKTNINSLWNSNSAYPGFQWNGGAYRTDNYGTYKSGDEDNGQFLTDRNKVDDIDFGNSMITDFDYAGSNYEKSTSAQIPTTKTDTNALINFTYENTNRPIGISTYGQETFSSVVSGNLNSDGYPSLVNTSLTDSSLKYLFTESIYAKKMNSDNIDGLFKKNSVTGEYSFNSRENHAQFDSSTNLFTLYNKIITPNFILYPFGNFLPFNDITDANKVTQVSAINYMFGDKGYVDELIERMETSAGYSSDTSKKQLVAMLKAYRANVKEWPGVPGGDTYIGNIDWDGWSAEDALNDFFNYYNYHNSSAEEPNDEIINFKTNSELQAHLQKMYNIDYDIDKNFFFGMEMKMNFMQPKGGVTGEDTNKDGTPDYDMVFEFTGDDDVWVYIDDILFLDLTGIHRHVGGKIDFVNGMVYYYALDSDGNGDISDNAYYEISFAKILTEVGGIKTSELGQYLKYDETTKTYSTFLDYSTHSFNFYYMERGSGSSVCSINFNFPLLRQNSISVSKEVSSEDNITELGNPDFKFQVLAATDAGEKTENLFIPAGTPYALYDAEGKAIQQVRVTKNPDGTLVTKEGLTLYTVTKADGTTVEGTVNDFINDTTIYKTDTNGIFPLKAGQKAEFVGISELAGKYYVRELLEDTIDEQYGTITVTGQAVTKTESLTIGSVAFIGLESPIYDASNASTSFEFNNKITTSELGKLKIQKILNLYDSSSDETREFEFAVTLDGEPLPVGTAYSILDSNGTDTRKKGTVEIITENGVTKSLVKISSGQIALIENILAGSAFTVEETSNSSKGYTVQYEAFDDSKIVISDGIVSGTIPVEAAIGVKIINAENGANVSIAGIKRLVCV